MESPRPFLGGYDRKGSEAVPLKSEMINMIEPQQATDEEFMLKSRQKAVIKDNINELLSKREYTGEFTQPQRFDDFRFACFLL